MKASTIALGAAAVGGGLAVYLITRPVAAKGPAPEGPLRPEPLAPDAEPLGPAAQRIDDLIDGLSDGEIINLRNAMPEHWWSYFTVAARQTDDDWVAFVFTPATIDYSIMTPEARQQMQLDIVAGIGFVNALELKSILEDAGVIS